MSDLERIKRYCAYQDRCEKEVRIKLKSLGVLTDQAEKYLKILVDEGFLNQKRYVESFIRGKLFLKKWGKQKIIFHLKQKDIDPGIIQEGLSHIEEQEYSEVLSNLFEKKNRELVHLTDPWMRRQKIQRFLIQKGFSFEEINKLFPSST